MCPLQAEGKSEAEEAGGQVPGGPGQGEDQSTLRPLGGLREEQSHPNEVEQACQVTVGGYLERARKSRGLGKEQSYSNEVEQACQVTVGET